MHPIFPVTALELVAGFIATTVLTPVLIAATIDLIVAGKRPALVPPEEPRREVGRPARRPPLRIAPCRI